MEKPLRILVVVNLPWDTRLGTLALSIPKLRTEGYFPSWLEPRRRAEQALVAVVQEAKSNLIGRALRMASGNFSVPSCPLCSIPR